MTKLHFRPPTFVLILIFLIASCSAVKETDVERFNGEGSPEPEEMFSPTSVDEIAFEGYQPSRPRINDLLHTKLNVRLDWQKKHLKGEASLTLKPFYHEVDTLLLDAKGFDIHRVAAMLADGEKEDLKYDYDGMKLLIHLNRSYKRNEEYSVWIDYTAKPDELVKNNEEIKGYMRGLFFIDADSLNETVHTHAWTQGESEFSSCWFPTIDAPNERCSQEIAITVNDKFKTLSNGKLIKSSQNEDSTRTDVWKQEREHPPYLAALVVGDYAVVKDPHPSIDISYYVEPAYAPYAKQMFKNTPQILDYFSQLFDYPYPWDKYAQITVHDFIASAMENTGVVVFFNDIQMTDEELKDKSYESVVAHEIVHHWFGNLLTCEAWSNIALNESFATYGEYLWFEHRYGRMFADQHLYDDFNKYIAEVRSKGAMPIIRHFAPDPEALFDRHTYEKGGRVLHMLRYELGDEMFMEGLRLYVAENAFKAVEIHHLRLAFEAVSGKDLSTFFEQWFNMPGHPELMVSYLPYDVKNGQTGIIVEQMQMLNGLPLFRFNVAVDVYMPDGSKTRHKITVDRFRQEFFFDAPQDPILINFDAEKMLLCEKNDAKTTETLIFQYQNAPLFLDKHEALDELLNRNEPIAVELCFEALRDTFWAFRELAARRIKLSEKNIADRTLPILKNLAYNDPNARVRKSALHRLAELKERSCIPELEKSLRSGFGTPSERYNDFKVLYVLDSPRAKKLAKELASRGKLPPGAKRLIDKEEQTGTGTP